MSHTTDPRVSLVYMPFGPLDAPSLDAPSQEAQDMPREQVGAGSASREAPR